MLAPSQYDGSLWEPNCTLNQRCGEWIELYNPNLCESVDISCYYLGNNAADLSNYGGGFVIPSGTIVPPRGFVVIRGQNAPAVPSAQLVQNGGNTIEIIPNSTNSCIGGGSRLWFPNAGGWFAFYNAAGVPQDAVSWATSANVALAPCVPNGCGSASSLSSYNAIPAGLKNYISNQSAGNHLNQTLRRYPDGGSWQVNAPATATYGTCNGPCTPPPTITCNGTATVIPGAGTPPYTYLWNDAQAQTTATAIELCAGTYCVRVTDNGGNIENICVEVKNLVPTVNLAPINGVCLDAAAVALGGTPVPASGETGVYAGAGISGTNFNPATAGAGTFNITYTYTDAHGCTNSAVQPATVHPLPTADISGLSSPYCLGSAPVTPALSPAGGTLTGNGTSGTTFTPAAAGVGTHTLTYTYVDANGCRDTDTKNVQVLSEPDVQLVLPPTLCVNGSPLTLTGTPAGGSFRVNGAPATAINPQNTGVGTQTVVYTYQDSNGCSGEAQSTLEVKPQPTLALGIDPYYCKEHADVTLNPTPAGGTLSGNGVTGNALNINNLTTGPHAVTYDYTDAFGCSNQLTQAFQVIKAATPDFNTEALCFQIVKFINQSPQAVDSITSAWSFGGMGTSAEHSPSFEFQQPGTFLVTLAITDGYGCRADTTKSVNVAPSILMSQVNMPNFITPNGDQVNDRFSLPSEFDECLTYRLIIFNRWGMTVYEMNNSADAFQGLTRKGAVLSDGVYYYTLQSDQIDCNDPAFEKICKGTLTILK